MNPYRDKEPSVNHNINASVLVYKAAVSVVSRVLGSFEMDILYGGGGLGRLGNVKRIRLGEEGEETEEKGEEKRK